MIKVKNQSFVPRLCCDTEIAHFRDLLWPKNLFTSLTRQLCEFKSR